MYDFFRPQDIHWDIGGLGTRIQNTEPLMFWHSPMQTQGPEPMKPRAPNQSIHKPPPQAPKQVTAQAFKSRVGSSRQGREGSEGDNTHRPCDQFKGTMVRNIETICTSRELAHEAQANGRRQRRGNVHSPTAVNMVRHQRNRNNNRHSIVHTCLKYPKVNRCIRYRVKLGACGAGAGNFHQCGLPP